MGDRFLIGIDWTTSKTITFPIGRMTGSNWATLKGDRILTGWAIAPVLLQELPINSRKPL